MAKKYTFDINQNSSIKETYETVVENSSSSSSSITYDKYVVVVVAGQSNAVGYDESPVEGFQYKNRNPKRIKQIGCWSSDTLDLISLGHCAHNIQDMSSYGTSGTKGIHLPLANLLLDYIPEDYGVLILPIAYGATGFISGSDGTYNSTLKRPNELTSQLNWRYGGAYYQTLRDRVKYAMDLNSDNIFGGVVWIQGESDASNPTSAATYFDAMTSGLFSDLSSYASRTISGKMDKSIWFNVETVNYWYTTYASASGNVTIWNHYKEWSPETYVAIEDSTSSNTASSTNNTNRVSSTYASHYGENAYEDVVAPALVKVMSQYFKYPVASATSTSSTNLVVELEDGGSYIPYSSFTETYSNKVTLDSYTDGTFKYTTDISGTKPGVAWSNPTPRVALSSDVTGFEFEVARSMYWMIIGENDSGNLYLMSVGPTNSSNQTGQVVYINNNSLSYVQQAYNSGYTTRTFSSGDKIKLIDNDNESVSVYYKGSSNSEYTLWWTYTYPSAITNHYFGFIFGISSLETTIGDDNTVLVRSMKLLDGDGNSTTTTVSISDMLNELNKLKAWAISNGYTE